MKRIAKFLVAMLPVVSACYTAGPIRMDVLTSGVHIYADLSERGSARVAPRAGEGISSVFGDVVGLTDSSITIAMRSITDRRGVETFWTGEHLEFLRGELLNVRERQLSQTRTAGAVALFALAILASLRIFTGAFGGGRDDGGSPQ